ncbi:MAG: helix-turn-helix domain-containing protein [Methanosarcinaceae archaeon]|nr:helix-turn-helix domain-containing protein [Methanosarcinaceae archaeon]
MPNVSTLSIFKELKKPASISELADLLGLDHSTVSTAISSLVIEGFAEKQRDGKKVFVKRSNTLHSRSLEYILNEYPRLPVEKLFTNSSMEVLSALLHPHNITDIAAMTGLNRHTVSSALSKLSGYGIVLKEKGRFILNKRHRHIVDLVNNYWRFAANQRLRDIADDAIILWQRGSEFLFKTQTDLGQSGEQNIHPTATTVFSRYDLQIITTTRYYFYSKRWLKVEDNIIHTILIDPQNPTYNSYAMFLAMQSGATDLLNVGRYYDMEKHIESLMEYQRTKEKKSNTVLPWSEYVDLFSSMVVVENV